MAVSVTPRPGLFPEAQPREINIGKGEWILPVSRNSHTYNTFMSVHLHLLSCYDHVNL